AIGAFITTDTTQRVGTYPFGTTTSFAQDSSTAILNIPAGSRVLYAELTWAGSWLYGGQNGSGNRNDSIKLTTPKATFTIAPDSTFQRNLGSSFLGSCSSTGDACFYTRSQNVTSMVQAGGNGTYTVGGVPGTVGASEDNLNCAGWTLGVV